jgi:predicted nucleic acid-binding protein
MPTYLLDSNVISDLIVRIEPIRQQVATHLAKGDVLAICRPVYYELLRGLYWRDATTKLSRLNNDILPLLVWRDLETEDWVQAAHFWADATSKGKQLADPDLFLAAIAHRTGAILVSSDADFDIIPINRENWR